MKRLLSIAASAIALTASPLCAQDIAISGATVATGDGSEPIENATVVVQNGRIVAAGADVVVPAGVPVIDGSGAWVTPGIFASLTNIGLVDVGAVDASNDVSAGDSEFSAALDVAPVINPAAQDFSYSRAGGVTRASVVPGASSGIFAGQGAIIDLGADYDAVREARAFQYVEMGERGASLAGGSRTATHVMLRNALFEAQRLAETGERDEDAMLTRFDAMALAPVLRGETQLYVEVNRASDILTALRLPDEFPGIDLVLVGATEGWMVADQIAGAGVPVIAAALRDLPASFEELAATQSNVGRMVDAGVTVAVMQDGSSGNYARNLPQAAGNLVALNRVTGATGLTWGEAFAAISSVPARIAGHANEGILSTGAHGDLVLWDGDPLEISSAPIRVWIDGVEQPLSNHQTRLRDRYRTLDESQLPAAYRR